MQAPPPILIAPFADHRWLGYVLEVFRGATGIPLGLLAAGQPLPEGAARVVYAPAISPIVSPVAGAAGCVSIPQWPLCDTHPEVTARLSGDLFRGSIIENAEIPVHHLVHHFLTDGPTVRSGGGVTFGFDLFLNAFLRLSCAAERRAERLRGPSHGYERGTRSASHLKPIVNYLFEALRLALIAVDPRLDRPRPQAGSPLYLTHDIDAVGRTFLKAAKQSAMLLSKIPRRLARRGPAAAGSALATALALPFGADDFDRIEAWRDWDKAAGAETAYYAYARGTGHSPVFDPGYDLAADTKLAARLKTLKNAGCTVGLHGSFNSHDDAVRLAAERKVLENALEAPVDEIRQHWLRFRFDATWKAQEEAGFKTDTGFGFNDVPGFRSWICHPHKPWNEARQAAHAITVVPMAAMDSTLFDYQDLPAERVVEILKNLVAETKKFGGRVAFNWHTHGASRRLKWDEAYRRALENS